MTYGQTRYCRWDSAVYTPKRDVGRDGFCCNACRQALYRARDKSSNAKAPAEDPACSAKRNKPKKSKKKKKLTQIRRVCFDIWL